MITLLRRLGSAVLLVALSAHAPASTTLIENVTLIDGNGGKPARGMFVTVEGQRITRIDSRPPSGLPADAMRIAGKGKYLLPGFIDTNVHASVYGNSKRRETAVKYAERNHEPDKGAKVCFRFLKPNFIMEIGIFMALGLPGLK